jgi:hypothetical protein
MEWRWSSSSEKVFTMHHVSKTLHINAYVYTIFFNNFSFTDVAIEIFRYNYFICTTRQPRYLYDLTADCF